MPFASATVPIHLLRGAIGLIALVLALAFAATSAYALLGLLVTVAAWRGCPTCWAVGLAQTRERERCRCEL
jgi:hypothetical protein